LEKTEFQRVSQLRRRRIRYDSEKTGGPEVNSYEFFNFGVTEFVRILGEGLAGTDF
jgi:hypothetical protein